MPGGGSKPGVRKGGRVKGTPNKLSIRTREALWQHCKDEGIDPFEVMVKLLKSTDARTRLMAASELADRLLPKLKSIELTGDPDKPVHVMNGTITPQERAARLVRIALLEAKRAAEHAQ